MAEDSKVEPRPGEGKNPRDPEKPAKKKAARNGTKSASRKVTKKASKKKVRKRAVSAGSREKKSSRRPEEPSVGSIFANRVGELVDGLTGELSNTARRWAMDVGAAQLRLGKAILLRKPTDPGLAKQAGVYLRELREVAGLTRDELSEAIELADHSLLSAVESGTATLSFELILRLAAVLARNDPLPFVLRLSRTYSPDLSSFLGSWGMDRLQLQFERERQFINIFRRHDAARKLSDEGFAKVLDFTRAGFEMALHFAALEENQEDHEVEVD